LDKKKMVEFTLSLTQRQTENEKIHMSTSTRIAEIPFSFLAAPRPTGSGTGVGSDSILIVDDNAEIRTFMRIGLEAYGYCCQEAEDGLVAIRQIRIHQCNVVLTDLNMPFLDGLGLAQYLKEDPSLGNPMVILMTATHTEMIARLARTFGIQDILSKPCLPSAVDRIIHPQEIKFPWAA